MKCNRTSILMLLIFVIVSSSCFAITCNESRVIIHSNETLSSSNYNMTIERSCTPEASVGSFIVVGITFIFLIMLILVGMIFIPNIIIKIMFAIPLLMFIIALVRYATIFIEISNPEQLNLINSLDTFYMIFTIIVYPLIILMSIFVIYLIITAIIESMRNKGKYKPL